jgi:uncharacterized SAM-binding protein YcdF (DUF218 family)
VRLIRRHPLLTAAAALGLAATILVSAAGVVVWREAHHDDASLTDRADAIIVLGAAQYDGEPSPVFAGRLDHAALLWEQDRADLVITLGGKRPGDRTTEAEAGRDYLVRQGLPSGSVVALPVGSSTWESLEAAASYLLDRDLRRAFLVSDPWHNARVKAMADDLGIRGYASATWTSGATSEEARGQGYVRETLAYLRYRLLGP